MGNVRSILSGQNKSKLVTNDNVTNDETCNCRQNPCPLQGRCNVKDIVYKAQITGIPNTESYIGCTSRKFIERYHVHKGSMLHRNSNNHTVLSKRVWELRDQGLSPLVTFDIFLKSRSAGPCEKRCNLCLEEKNAIIKSSDPYLINNRNEIFTKCRHRNRWKLGTLT